MVMKFTNNATTTLASSIVSGATSLTVATGTGALFPSLGAGDYFYCTLANTAGTVEIVKVTARSTDTFTVTRAQDNTTAVGWSAGDKVELRLVAASLNDIPKLDETNTFSQTQTFTAAPVLSSTTASLPLFTDSNKKPTSATMTGTGDVVMSSGASMTSPSITTATLTNPTVTNYVESVVYIGTVTTSNTLSLTNGTVQTATLTASTACTFTMPTETAGKSFVLLLKQAASTGNGTATFTSVKWNSSGAPTITATAGKMDILTFVADGTNWYGSYSQGYTP